MDAHLTFFVFIACLQRTSTSLNAVDRRAAFGQIATAAAVVRLFTVDVSLI
jgi:hypothetical protein